MLPYTVVNKVDVIIRKSVVLRHKISSQQII